MMIMVAVQMMESANRLLVQQVIILTTISVLRTRMHAVAKIPLVNVKHVMPTRCVQETHVSPPVAILYRRVVPVARHIVLI